MTTYEVPLNRRTALISVAIVAALALLTWFTIRELTGKSSARSSSNTMAGMTTDTTSHASHASHTGAKPLVAGANGTRASAGGLTLEPKHAAFSPGQTTQWQLRVVDRMKMTVTKFEREQTKLMHLIVVRSDLTDYQHVHPALGRRGIFTIDLRLPRPGTYRAIADFTTGGRRYALGVPIEVPGGGTQAPLPAESMQTTTDGFSVETMHGQPKAGGETDLQFTIRRKGQPVTALLPYLGAYGHLVALRKRDIAYSHVHPTSKDRSKGLISFAAEFPTSGAYRLFLQFRTSSGVHTAPFTIKISS